MSAAKFPHPDSSEGGNIQPNLSPEAQRDLAHALEDDEKEAWVEETRSSLMKAFALGRKVDAPPQKGIDVYTAVEGTEKDLRHTLVSIISLVRDDLPRKTRADAWQRKLYMINMVNWPCMIEGLTVWLPIGWWVIR